MRRDNAALAVKIIRSHGMWVAVAAWLRKLGRSKCLFLIVPTLEGFHIYNFYIQIQIHTYIMYAFFDDIQTQFLCMR